MNSILTCALFFQVTVCVVLLVGIGSSQSQPVNTNINTNTNNNYNSNLATIYLFQAILKLSEIISGLQRSGVLEKHNVPPFPISIHRVKALVRQGIEDLKKPDPVQEALSSTDSYGDGTAQNDGLDEDDEAAFHRLVGDRFGGVSTDSDDFRGTLEIAMKAFKGSPVPPISSSDSEDEWR